MSEWIDCKDRLPDLDPEYGQSAILLLWRVDHRTYSVGSLLSGDVWYFIDDDEVGIDGVSHWMPLPDPPRLEG